MNKYFLYRHIRLDKSEVFYIGIGTVNEKSLSFKRRYKRAFEKTKTQRSNKYWQRIVSLTEYDVEIILESSDLNFICEKEKEFIALYGRRDLNLGTLCNFTDGGRGMCNYIVSDDTKTKLRKKSWVSGKFGKSHHRSRSVYAYKITGEFIKEYGGHREAARELNIDRGNIHQILKHQIQECYGITFFEEYKGERIDPIIITNKKIRSVAMYSKDLNHIKNFNTITEASKEINSSTSSISKACKNFGKISVRGFYFKYA